jgi:hypothetical protein
VIGGAVSAAIQIVIWLILIVVCTLLFVRKGKSITKG